MDRGRRKRENDAGAVPRASSVLRLAIVLCVAGAFAVGLHHHGARAQASGGHDRLALVIGNSAYGTAPLPTSVADAGLVARSLAKAGFDVTAMANVDAETVKRTVDRFATEVEAAGPHVLCVVYLAGYGLQFDGANYFVPTGTTIVRDTDVPAAAVKLDDLFKRIEAAPARGRVFLYDLARETPFARVGRPLAGGLVMEPVPSGDEYAFNAAPGTVAARDLVPYGAYARAVAEAIDTDNGPIAAALRRLRLRVGEETGGNTVPWEDGSLDPSLSFRGAGPADPAPNPSVDALAFDAQGAFSAAVAEDTLLAYADYVARFPASPLASRAKGMLAVRREATYWVESLRIGTPRAYWTYMRRYPRGPHIGDARRLLADSRAALQPPPRFDLVTVEGLPSPSADELAFLDRPVVTFDAFDWPSIPAPPSILIGARNPAFFADLQPPPIVPASIMPIPFVGEDARASKEGSILQPFTAAGPVEVRFSRNADGASVLTYRAADKLLLQNDEAVVDGAMTVTERANTKDVVATSSASSSKGVLTLLQTDSRGAVLWRSVTTPTPDGRRSTIVTNGSGSVLAASWLGKDGIRKSAAQARPPAPELQSIASGGPSAPLVLPGATEKPPLPPMDLPSDNTTPAAPFSAKSGAPLKSSVPLSVASPPPIAATATEVQPAKTSGAFASIAPLPPRRPARERSPATRAKPAGLRR